jgi:hypothetical protein
MSHYGLKLKYISNLENIDSSGKHYHRYKGVQFYHKKNDDSDKLVVTFHGSMFKDASSPTGMVLLPIFRGVDWTHNVLCMADKLLEDFSNEKLQVAWFLSPHGSNYLQIYTEIIEHVMKSYNNIIFHGSSAGGFPSLYFSCIFHQKALILNAQFYIERYSLFNSFTKSTDMILTKDFEEFSSEAIVSKHGPPGCAYIVCNEKDTNHMTKQFLPFKGFVETGEREKMKKHFVLRTFSNKEEPPPGKTHHTVFLPTGTSMNSLFHELFDKQLD